MPLPTSLSTGASEGGLKEIVDWLEQEVKSHYSTANRGIVLQELGARFSRKFNHTFQDYLDFIAVASKIRIPRPLRKLEPFIRTYCSDIYLDDTDRVQIVALPKVHPQSTGIAAALKQIATVLTPSGKEEEPKQLPAADAGLAKAQVARFARPFWVAFIRPVTDGKIRYVSNAPKVAFKDFPEGTPSPGGEWTQIETKYIVGAPEGEFIDPAVISEKIDAWAKDHTVDLASYLDKGTGQRKDRERNLESGEKLGSFLNSLPPELARRIRIPGDVIMHILKK